MASLVESAVSYIHDTGHSKRGGQMPDIEESILSDRYLKINTELNEGAC